MNNINHEQIEDIQEIFSKCSNYRNETQYKAENVRNLLANLMHYCEENNISFSERLQNATHHYYCEGGSCNVS